VTRVHNFALCMHRTPTIVQCARILDLARCTIALITVVASALTTARSNHFTTGIFRALAIVFAAEVDRFAINPRSDESRFAYARGSGTCCTRSLDWHTISIFVAIRHTFHVIASLFQSACLAITGISIVAFALAGSCSRWFAEGILRAIMF